MDLTCWHWVIVGHFTICRPVNLKNASQKNHGCDKHGTNREQKGDKKVKLTFGVFEWDGGWGGKQKLLWGQKFGGG